MKNREKESILKEKFAGRQRVKWGYLIYSGKGKRGTVITGKVESGTVTTGDQVTLRRVDGNTREVTVAGIEMFRKMLDTAKQGDNVGLLLRGLDRRDVGRGDILEKVWQ